MWDILETLRPYSTLLSLIAVTLITVSVYDCIAEWRKAKQVRVTMSKSEIGERDKYVKETISDGICDLLETLHYQDKISREERDFYYFVIGNRCGLPDLVPMYVIKHPNPDSLKEKILKRLGSKSTVGAKLSSIFNRRRQGNGA